MKIRTTDRKLQIGGMQMKIFGHRGYALRYPENTLVSFQAAVDAGADGIETDVHLTRDGVLVLTHDEEISRVSSGHGLVKDMTYEELLALDFGSWKDPRFTGERIPTLDQLLDLLEDTSLILNLEVKMGFPYYPGIEEKLLEKIRARNFLSRIIFSSFNHYSVAKIKALEPKALVAPLYMEALYEPYHYAETFGAGAIHPQAGLVEKSIVDACHEKNIAVNLWTVNRTEDALKAQDLGVDAIITDCPLELITALRS